ncbi:MAG: DUF3817 domain-containing protein [Verrucomicrobiota bacterium]|nr:DUF3817 domain-containing protein [Verrucomicrobiota bacterium]
MKNPITLLRKISFFEGVSYLLLLGVAMPLKYIWGMPGAVKIVGALHGGLFVLLCFSLLQTWIVAKWPFSRAAMVFVAALLPFGPLYVDHKLAFWEAKFKGSGN